MINKKRAAASILSLVLLLIICSLPADALLVGPARITLPFEPNYLLEYDVCYVIQNNAYLRFSVQGAFADSVEMDGLDETGVKVMTTEDSCLHYRMRLPKKVDAPGKHRTIITAVEVPPEATGNINFVVRVQHQIDVIVPYPGKYLEIENFAPENSKAGESVPIRSVIRCKGNDTISAAQGTIKIYDNSNKLIGEVKTNTATDIKTEETKDLFAKWDSSGFKEGNYRATLEVDYDGLLNNASARFKLGGLDISLINYSRDVIIGGIKEYYVIVDSIWSEPISNVRAKVDVYNFSLKEEPLTSFETLTRTIEPWSQDYLKGYIDTSSLGLGRYDVKINLLFENMSKPYDGELNIINEPVVDKEPSKKNIVISTKVLLIALGVLLLITAIILVLALLPRRKKKDQEDNPPKPS